jgi:hypothetical protein
MEGAAVNCKPGDLARVVHTIETELIGMADKIVRVTVASRSASQEMAWAYEGEMFKCKCTPSCTNVVQCIPDEDLRPIRDPGDDARDETLTWLPVPSRSTEPEAA